ncbi:LysR family transcriptional regulator [Novosphingobium guangzhouense]|uniref:Transcriptional regulator n=1 Tax=Novosphingobium guangzhouense TaxID=1850347 RepID=A0A2K2G6R9_9SPHN|nr:LysR family transcriptional regulator [Novosphingobium guangzhouense]PNU06720.1 transcriptional regulator [Novosphingobium guangzhouense]
MSDLIRSLRLFVRLNEEGSFSALGRRQNLSHTTIARAIRDIEQHFDVRLFQRTTRSQALTADGERLLEHAVAILDQVGMAEADLAGTVAARGLVRVGVTTALGLHYAGRLSAMAEHHPELMVEWLVADWRDAADHGGLDLWLWVGSRENGNDADGQASSLLGELPRILVAAPDYLDRHGMPRSVDDLTRHQCLTYGYAARPAPWPIDGRKLEVSGFLRANSSEAVLRATRGGLGIGLLPRIQVEEDLARGQVVPVLPDADIPSIPVMLANGFRGMRMPMRARVVLEFLESEFPA